MKYDVEGTVSKDIMETRANLNVKTVTYNKYVGVTSGDESKFPRTSVISNYYLKLKIIS